MQSIVIGKDLRLIIRGELDSASLDASKQDISPGYAIIMAWWLTLPVSAALTSLNISGNYLTYKDAIDGDLSGLIELGKAMAASSTLSSINFAKCLLGPKAAAEVAKVCAASAALTSLEIFEAMSVKVFGYLAQSLSLGQFCVMHCKVHMCRI